jgi:hypothetical protein
MSNGSNSSRPKAEALATSVTVSKDRLEVTLTDGRTVGAPVAWYPRLQGGTMKERRRYELIGGGEGIHWPDLDEDISVENLLDGEKSAESQRSLSKWKRRRQKFKSLAPTHGALILRQNPPLKVCR